MSSGIKSSQRDLTALQRPMGAGAADMRRSWLCGHKSHGGKKRAGLLWKCAKCAGEKA
jgi:hypothetical protein